MKKILPLCFVILHCLASNAQQGLWEKNKGKLNTSKNTRNKTKDKLVGYKTRVQQWGLDTGLKHTFLVGGKLNSDGWSGNTYFVKKKKYPYSSMWQIGFAEIRHEKQTKVKGKSNTELGNSLPYVYGKINHVYTLQVGVGHQRVLLPSVLEGKASVAIRYNIGASVAMLKPYYLKLTYLTNIGGVDTTLIEEHHYSSADSAKFLNPDAIFGASKWQKSLNEISLVPGVYYEVAFALLPVKSKTVVQAITLGINGAMYAQKLPIMAEQKAYYWQASLFAGFAIGKRW